MRLNLNFFSNNSSVTIPENYQCDTCISLFIMLSVESLFISIRKTGKIKDTLMIKFGCRNGATGV